MSNLSRTMLVAGAVLVAGGFFVTALRSEAAPPDRDSKFVQIACKPGWRGSAAGQYGGVSFGVACDNGRGTTRIDGVVGTSYSVRMGVENATGAFDCFFTGDAQVVNESCVDVRLMIR